MDVSIVIPSYNTQDTIADTLDSLQSQKADCQYEIILIDCSEHEQVRKQASSFSNVVFIHEEKRFNPGAGRNIGSHHAQGKLLIFIDADIRLDVHAIQNAWQRFQEGYRVFGGALELNKETSLGMSSYLEHFFFNHESQANRPVCERANLSSALLCIDRKLFLQEGGFRDIPRMQDTELTERLRAQGQHLYFFPDILTYQTQDSPLRKVFRKIYVNGQNLYYIRYLPTMTMPKKILFFLVLPLLGLAKISRIILRHLRYQSARGKMMTIFLTVPLVLAILYWIGGFYHALLTEQGISTQR